MYLPIARQLLPSAATHISRFLQAPVAVGTVTPMLRLDPLRDTTVMVPLLGQVQGLLVCTFGLDTALAVANRVLAAAIGMPVELDALDDDARSVLCEMMNVAAGSAMGDQERAGLHLNISVPSLLESPAQARITPLDTQIFAVDAVFDGTWQMRLSACLGNAER